MLLRGRQSTGIWHCTEHVLKAKNCRARRMRRGWFEVTYNVVMQQQRPAVDDGVVSEKTADAQRTPT